MDKRGCQKGHSMSRPVTPLVSTFARAVAVYQSLSLRRPSLSLPTPRPSLILSVCFSAFYDLFLLELKCDSHYRLCMHARHYVWSLHVLQAAPHVRFSPCHEFAAWLTTPFWFAAYFIVTEPTINTQWKNGQNNVVTWSKGLKDGISAFDIEMSRLSSDGLTLIAKNGAHASYISGIH